MSNLCVVTGKETEGKANNIPLSVEGRSLLKDIVDEHNQKILEVYAESTKEANNGVVLDEETLKHFAPKISTKKALTLLQEEEKDIIETKNIVILKNSGE